MTPEKHSKSKILKLQKLWKRQQIQCCVECFSDTDLTVDHIIPKAILRAMRYDPSIWWDADNLRLLCSACNEQKGDFLDLTVYGAKDLMIKYLKLLLPQQ